MADDSTITSRLRLLSGATKDDLIASAATIEPVAMDIMATDLRFGRGFGPGSDLDFLMLFTRKHFAATLLTCLMIMGCNESTKICDIGRMERELWPYVEACLSSDTPNGSRNAERACGLLSDDEYNEYRKLASDFRSCWFAENDEPHRWMEF